MKYLPYLITIILLPLVFMADRIVPRPTMSGELISISEVKTEPLPHRLVSVATKKGPISTQMYESAQVYRVGDIVLLSAEGGDENTLIVSDKLRTPSLVSLATLFVIVIILVSGMNGVRSLLGLAFSFMVIFSFVLPQIVAGSNPIVVALLSSILILMVSYFLSHGINSKSIIAVLGTFAALVVTGVLASLYGAATGLTGFGSEEAGFLIETLPKESFYKLLLAGIIIGSLGVLDDITISQASIVEELKHANHRLGFAELFASAMRIGHDHIASLVNTLVLVYAGSSLPLLLLFISSKTGYIELLNYEALTEEIVRTLVASIGLVTAVPLTTLIASYWHSTRR